MEFSPQTITKIAILSFEEEHDVRQTALESRYLQLSFLSWERCVGELGWEKAISACICSSLRVIPHKYGQTLLSPNDFSFRMRKYILERKKDQAEKGTLVQFLFTFFQCRQLKTRSRPFHSDEVESVSWAVVMLIWCVVGVPSKSVDTGFGNRQPAVPTSLFLS